ncbi:TolC family protein [Nitrospina watsonii]|uniref:Heavy metal RND efflux outer membrane protein, CzcC family n=1 Tax=Nitrospina watsonii TaxID=1323948 RepID=A0ABN8W0V5_9BACT|nr:TolC family protein [Nitrospina watsonii]CAI2719654.1 Heavy metal RND efflux outer membrane protein, CzcC family [Nitrospina watsonii]
MTAFNKLAGMGALVLFMHATPAVSQSAPSPDFITGPEGTITFKNKVTSNDPRDLTGVLTLRQATAHILLHNPDLQVFGLEIRAREARALQEGLLPNPQVQAMVQDVLGSGQFSGASDSENQVLFTQWIELGGKRTKRETAANLKTELAEWDYETARMNVLTATAKAYVDVLAQQQALKLVHELEELSERLHTAVAERVKAGKVPPIDEVKAQVTLSTTRMQRRQAENELHAARRRLAALWGRPLAAFHRVQGNLYGIQFLPPLEELAARLNQNPDLARWATEMIQRDAQVDLEESRSIPNLQMGVGARWLQENRDNSVMFQLQLPIQLFDRNQGAIAEARYRKSKAEAQQRAMEIKLQTVLSNHHARLVNAHTQVTSLKNQVLPGAKMAFDAVQEGYRYGKFGYLEVLDSQRTWFQAREQYLQALAEYHRAVADVERLIGAPLNQQRIDASPTAEDSTP